MFTPANNYLNRKPVSRRSLAIIEKSTQIMYSNLQTTFNEEATSTLAGFPVRHLFAGRTGTWKCFFLRREDNRRTQRVDPWKKSQSESQQPNEQYRIQASSVGGEWSQHYSTPASQKTGYLIYGLIKRVIYLTVHNQIVQSSATINIMRINGVRLYG